jgi:hypothetical protein
MTEIVRESVQELVLDLVYKYENGTKTEHKSILYRVGAKFRISGGDETNDETIRDIVVFGTKGVKDPAVAIVIETRDRRVDDPSQMILYVQDGYVLGDCILTGDYTWVQ